MKQDFQDWEAIIVDDGSTDNSVEIIETYAHEDSRIKLFTSEKNSGGAYTPRLRAATLASADVLIIIDADDKVSANLLSSHYQKIATLNSDLVIPDMYRQNEKEWYKILPLPSIDVAKVWRGKELVGRTLCRWEIPMAGFAISRSLYLQADEFISLQDKKSVFADELLTRWFLFLCQRVTFCDAAYYYRCNEESVTHVNVPNLIESRLLTCDNLIGMTSKSFGHLSPEHLKALDNKFLSAVNSLRLLNHSKLASSQTSASLTYISNAMNGFPLEYLKGRLSPRYLALMRLPIPLARYALKIIDPILGIK